MQITQFYKNSEKLFTSDDSFQMYLGLLSTNHNQNCVVTILPVTSKHMEIFRFSEQIKWSIKNKALETNSDSDVMFRVKNKSKTIYYM